MGTFAPGLSAAGRSIIISKVGPVLPGQLDCL